MTEMIGPVSTRRRTRGRGRLRSTLAALLAVLVGVSGLAVVSAVPVAAAEPGFVSGSLAGASVNKPTAMQWGPDGRLYVLELDGDVKALSVTRNGPADYVVTATETIDLVKGLPNHGDDGAAAPSVTGRVATGLKVTGTADGLLDLAAYETQLASEDEPGA